MKENELDSYYSHLILLIYQINKSILRKPNNLLTRNCCCTKKNQIWNSSLMIYLVNLNAKINIELDIDNL